jgi:hypothetical protein
MNKQQKKVAIIGGITAAAAVIAAVTVTLFLLLRAKKTSLSSSSSSSNLTFPFASDTIVRIRNIGGTPNNHALSFKSTNVLIVEGYNAESESQEWKLTKIGEDTSSTKAKYMITNVSNNLSIDSGASAGTITTTNSGDATLHFFITEESTIDVPEYFQPSSGIFSISLASDETKVLAHDYMTADDNVTVANPDLIPEPDTRYWSIEIVS